MGFIDDIKGVFERDPAAKNVIEVITCYPGLHALWMHRIAHFFWNLKIPVIPRMISHFNRFMTGIEIHPGATIGKRFFIDHGSGVVIGETTEIGDNVLLYSEVVLGGTSLAKKKRHPTLEDDVVVGTGAKVLGAITLGKGAKVGACSVVVKSVPPGATVVGIPAKIVRKEEPEHKIDLQHGDIPDPVARCVECLMDKIDSLEKDMSSLKQALIKKELGALAAGEVLAQEAKRKDAEDESGETCPMLKDGCDVSEELCHHCKSVIKKPIEEIKKV
jgi:serine O-acetyltransferase